MIFRRYLELGSVRELKAALDAEGIVSKRRTAADGSAYGGQSFSRGALYQMLQNRVYRGEIVHKGAAYPGEHPPIVDEELWRARPREARSQRRRPADRARGSQTSLSAGRRLVRRRWRTDDANPRHQEGRALSLLCLTPADHGRQGEAGARSRAPDSACRPVHLERLVVDRLETFFADPDAVTDALPPATPGRAEHQARARRRARTSSAQSTRAARQRVSTSFARSSLGPRFISIGSTSTCGRTWSRRRSCPAAIRLGDQADGSVAERIARIRSGNADRHHSPDDRGRVQAGGHGDEIRLRWRGGSNAARRKPSSDS